MIWWYLSKIAFLHMGYSDKLGNVHVEEYMYICQYDECQWITIWVSMNYYKYKINTEKTLIQERKILWKCWSLLKILSG
jgi:hypothetical protein